MAKSRKRDGPKFVRLFEFILASAAWRSLSPGARALYVEIHRTFNGKNNGRLMLSHRRAAEALNVHRNSVGQWFKDLEGRGLIAKTSEARLGVEGVGQTAQWRLTHLPTASGRPPTMDFQEWREI